MVAAKDILGYYRLIAPIGVGGMGEVWTAEDTRLSRTVALKILPPSVASDQEAIARLRREARMAARLNHPNIATIHSIEEVGDRLFIVMEYVEGEPLAKLIERGALEESEICRIGAAVADALAEAHAKGVIHRDIKPDNIIVNGARVKVLDFGIAKQIDVQADAADPTAFMTQQGMIVGTVHYMSPEQALGKELDARTDIFSLGVVLYQAATGRLPFQGETVTDTITRIVRDEPPDIGLVNRALTPNFTRIVARCLRKSREQRFGSAGEVATVLNAQLARAAAQPPAPVPPRPAQTILTGSKLKTVTEPARRSRAWIFVVAALAAIAGVVALSMKRPKPVPAVPAPAAVAAVPSSGTMTVSAPAASPAPAATAPTETTISESAATRANVSAPPRKAAATTDTAAADALYERGVTHLAEQRPREAREAFLAALEKDPHCAKARLRLGEIALFERDRKTARTQFEGALADAGRLTSRGRGFAELGLALADGNIPRAREIVRVLHQENPADPELAPLRALVVRAAAERRDAARPRPHRPRQRPRPGP